MTKAFVCFAKTIIKITTLTGAAACEIATGRVLHSEACLSSRKSWTETKGYLGIHKMLIIEWVSFLDEDNIRKLDKNIRKLKERNAIYGGLHAVYVGDFFQMLPIRSLPLFKTTPYNLMLSIEQSF